MEALITAGILVFLALALLSVEMIIPSAGVITVVCIILTSIAT
jgi:hypothetical protein